MLGSIRSWAVLAAFSFLAAATADSVQLPGASNKNVLTTTLTSAQIDGYIAQLGSKDFRQRNEAKTVLEQLGPIALPHLKAALQKTTDPEVKRHLTTLIPSLEQQKALAPTQITFKAENKPLKEVIKELEKQSGYKIELVAGNVKNDQLAISVTWDKVSFWEAVQTLTEQCGLMIQEGWYGNDNMTVRFIQGDAPSSYIQLHGPFRVSATGFYYNRNILFNNRGQAPSNNVTETLQMNLTVSVEPKMPLLSARPPIFTEATDDAGDSLILPINPQRNSYHHGYRSYMHQISGQLKPAAGGRRLKSLKGTVPVTVVAQTNPLITIDKLGEAKNKTVKQNSTTINIQEVTQNNGHPGIKMSITESTPGGQNDYTWMNSIQQRIEVFDDKGTKLQSYGGSWSMNGNNSINGTFTYSGVPAKLVYYEWHTLSYQVPFSFTDLPLP
jgi:hypothetical protein